MGLFESISVNHYYYPILQWCETRTEKLYKKYEIFFWHNCRLCFALAKQMYIVVRISKIVKFQAKKVRWNKMKYISICYFEAFLRKPYIEKFAKLISVIWIWFHEFFWPVVLYVRRLHHRIKKIVAKVEERAKSIAHFQ